MKDEPLFSSSTRKEIKNQNSTLTRPPRKKLISPFFPPRLTPPPHPTIPTQTHSISDVCIIGAVRTPIGGLLGSLSSLTATQLGGEAISAALRAARIHVSGPPPASIGPPAEGAAPSSESKDRGVVDEVIMGNVLSAGLGQVR